jgi:hypothetical protein
MVESPSSKEQEVQEILQKSDSMKGGEGQEQEIESFM